MLHRGSQWPILALLTGLALRCGGASLTPVATDRPATGAAPSAPEEGPVDTLVQLAPLSVAASAPTKAEGSASGHQEESLRETIVLQLAELHCMQAHPHSVDLFLELGADGVVAGGATEPPGGQEGAAAAAACLLSAARGWKFPARERAGSTRLEVRIGP